MRIAMGVEYDGSGFSGWQIQPQGDVRTVQGSVEQALAVADALERARTLDVGEARAH